MPSFHPAAGDGATTTALGAALDYAGSVYDSPRIDIHRNVLLLSGSGNRVTFSGLTLGASETVSFWIRTTATQGTVLGGGASNFGLCWQDGSGSASQTGAAYSALSVDSVSQSTAITRDALHALIADGEWHFVEVTLDLSNAAFAALQIGSGDATTFDIAGEIADFKIDGVLHLPMEGDLLDVSGNGNHGTLSGTTGSEWTTWTPDIPSYGYDGTVESIVAANAKIAWPKGNGYLLFDKDLSSGLWDATTHDPEVIDVSAWPVDDTYRIAKDAGPPIKLYARHKPDLASMATSMVFAIDTTQAGSASNAFVLPLFNTETYDFLIEWGDGTYDEITAWNQAELTHYYAEEGEYTVAIHGRCPRLYFNNTGDKAKLISITQGGDLSQSATQTSAFYGCVNLVSVDLTGADLSGVAYVTQMFRLCTSLTTFLAPGWTLAAVTIGNSMFRECSSLATIDTSGWNLALMTNGGNMFSGCVSLIALNSTYWSLDALVTADFMFYNCALLTSLDTSNWTLAALTNGTGMFYNCSSLTTLDTSNWTLEALTVGSYMFYGITLTTLDTSNWTLAAMTVGNNMFQNCASLTDLDTSNWTLDTLVTGSYMFYNCSSLTDLGISNWTLEALTNGTSMFLGVTLTTATYNRLLDTMNTNNPNTGVTFHGGNSQYDNATGGFDGAAARAALLARSPAWTITDGGPII